MKGVNAMRESGVKKPPNAKITKPKETTTRVIDRKRRDDRKFIFYRS
jgi:hypothetical protein